MKRNLIIKMLNLKLFMFIVMATARMSRLGADRSWETAEERMPVEKYFEVLPESSQGKFVCVNLKW